MFEFISIALALGLGGLVGYGLLTGGITSLRRPRR
jgi:hypothetical protein